MLLLIGLTSFLAVTLTIVAFLGRSENPVEARAGALRSDAGFGARPISPLLAGRKVSPTAQSAIAGIRRILPDRWYDRLERALIAAGRPVDPGLFLLLWTVFAIGLPFIGKTAGGQWGLILGIVVGVLGPYLWLRRLVRRRKRRMSAALPDVIDLLVACVEAGLGMEAAFIRVAEVTEGPLADELRLTLHEISVGRPRQEALLELGTRTGVADLDAFLRPVIQAERMGVSIADSLRVQAEAMRERRRQRAREFAEKLPVKMSIAMMVFFLPAILIIGIAPSVFTMAKILSGLGL